MRQARAQQAQSDEESSSEEEDDDLPSFAAQPRNPQPASDGKP